MANKLIQVNSPSPSALRFDPETLPLLIEAMGKGNEAIGLPSISPDDFDLVKLSATLNKGTSSLRRIRLTDYGTSKAHEFARFDRLVSSRLPGRQEAVLAYLLRWVNECASSHVPINSVIENFVNPISSPAVSHLRISYREIRQAATTADELRLCVYVERTGILKLTGYGQRCVAHFGGDYSKMDKSDGPGHTIHMRDGNAIIGNKNTAEFGQSKRGAGSALNEERQLAHKILDLVVEHRDALDRADFVERDARAVADALEQPVEEQDRDAIQTTLERMQTRVVGVHGLVLAVQMLWTKLFG